MRGPPSQTLDIIFFLGHRRHMSDGPIPIEFVEPGPAPAEPFPDRKAAAAQSRVMVSIPLNDDGHPDWSRAREKTIDKFKEIVNDDATKELLGKKGAEIPPLSKDFVNFALDTFFRTEAMVFAVSKKIPPALAFKLFQLSAEEHEKIDPLAGRVLAKWLPEWLVKFEDEIALAGLLINSSVAHFAIATAAIEAQRKKEKEAKTQPGNAEPKGAIPVYVDAQEAAPA